MQAIGCERAGVDLRAFSGAVQALRGAGVGRSFAICLPDICSWRLIGGDEEREMDAFDAVVVGAGHNGLAAAIHLLNRGWSVAVIEQAGEPGGAVKTREITLLGFRHDLCAMNLSLFAGSPFFAAYKDELMAQGLAFAPAGRLFRQRLSRPHISRRQQGSREDSECDCGALGEGRRGLASDACAL